MRLRTVIGGWGLALASLVVAGFPVTEARAATVGSGDCTSTVDNSTGVTSSLDSSGACVIVFATAPTSPTTSQQSTSRTWTVPAGVTSVNVLVVAGGGGGGMSNCCTPTGGGGGGGGIVLATDRAVTPAATITVTTGYGGQGGNCSPGSPGGNSTFGALTAVGGGFGGGCGPAYGGPGGSAGGAHWGQPQGFAGQSTSGTASNGTNISAYGGDGGRSYPHGVSGDAVSAGGGGGGGATTNGGDATQPGANASSGVGGNGGEGLANSWRTGSAVVYGSGGGGQGRATQGIGGTNAGTGSGTNAAGGGVGIDAVDETGAGGGAGYRQGGGRAGDGGSGVVIVRYFVASSPANSSAPTVSGTTTNGQTLTGAHGTWTGYPAPTLTYQWKRASAASGTYANIPGATAINYTLTDDDINRFLKLEVTATNASGTATALSAATAQIADMVRPTTTTSTTPAPSTTAPALVVNVSAPTTTLQVIPSATTAVATPVIRNTSTVTTTTAGPATSAVSTSTTQPSATTTSTAPAPQPATVEAGQAAMTVGGETVAPTVERRDNTLVITAGEYTATLAAIDSKGNVAALDSQGNVRLGTGQSIRVNASGFEPETVMEVWLFSTPVKLGEMSVDGTGTVSGTFTIPAGTPTGSHRMMIVAKGDKVEDTTLTVGLMVGEWGKEGVATWLIVVPLVLAVLLAVFIPTTLRRRRRGVAAA